MEGLDPVLTPLPPERQGAEGRRVVTAAILVLGLVGLGKVAGFAREITVVARFGASAETDGFFTAYAVFNIVWVMALATSLAPAVVPSLARIEVLGDLARRRRAAGIFSGTGLVLSVILAGLAFLFAESIIRLVAPELAPGATAAGTDALRLLSLGVVPIVFAGVLGAVLQAHDRFAAAASSTLIVSASMVVFTLGLSGQLGITAVSLGVLVGSVLQLLVLVPDLLAARPLQRPRREDVTDASEAGRRVGPVSGLAGLVAVRPAMERSFAATLGTGLVTLVGLGSRTGSFFASLVGTALATAVFPHLARAAARGDEPALRRTLRFAVSFTVVTSLPVAVAILLLSGDMATLLFRHGSVTADDAARIAAAMTSYAPAILLAPLVDVLARTRYAHGDATSPLVAAGVGLLANAAVLAVAPVVGLGAFGLGFSVNVVAMLAVLGARERSLLGAFVPEARSVALAGAATGAALASYLVSRQLAGGGGSVPILLALLVATAVYLAVVAAVILPRRAAWRLGSLPPMAADRGSER